MAVSLVLFICATASAFLARQRGAGWPFIIAFTIAGGALGPVVPLLLLFDSRQPEVSLPRRRPLPARSTAGPERQGRRPA